MKSILLLVFCLGIVVDCYRIQYTNYKLLRIAIDQSASRWFYQFAETHHEFLDIWSEPKRIDHKVDILIKPEFYPFFLRTIQKKDIHNYQLLSDNIQSEFDRELKVDMQRYRNRRKRETPFHPEKYHDYAQIVDFMLSLAARYPDIVRTVNITKSFEKRNLVGLRIGKPSDSLLKPSILIDGCAHAREWISSAVAIYIGQKLVNEFENNTNVRSMLETFDVVIIPVVNPDGYEYSINTDRMWRKTRSFNVSNSLECVGVDPNRNWGYRWTGDFLSQDPCYPTYRGWRPFSEPEIAGIRDYLLLEMSTLKLYISMHSYGQLWLGPWGYADIKPDNYLDQKAAAEKAIAAIWKNSGQVYKYGTIANIMYPAHGNSIDYMQNLSIPYIYGVELRPEKYGFYNNGFSINASFIKPTGEEMFASLLAICDYIVKMKKL